MEETSSLSKGDSERPGDCSHEVKMDASPGLANVTTNDPYRKKGDRVYPEIAKDRSCKEPDLRRRLEMVESELERSKSEVKKLRYELVEANQERKEILRTVSSLHVQMQYWNSWFGSFSQHFNEKSIKTGSSDEDKHRNVDESVNERAVEESSDVDAGVVNSIDCKNDNGLENGTIGNNSKIGFNNNKNGDGKKCSEGKSDSEDKNSVADMIKETAESAFADSGMAYDENSGLYYDWNSHMYYDPNTHLFYDNDNGIYYYYDHTKGSYVFYSQVNVTPTNDANVLSPLSAEGKSEGEISSSDGEIETETVPCIRAIVAASEAVKVGTLYLVTCSGTTIGRDKTQRFNLLDRDASKVHALIKYDEKDSKYIIRDCGSVNGTFLNGKRLGESRVESEWFPVNHKDFLKIGSTVFVLHVHRGQETCNDCEPGQVQAMLSSLEYNTLQAEYGSSTKEELRKKQLRGLKEKYMVSGDGLKQALEPITSGKYRDRANKRRRNIGSEPIKHALQSQMEDKSSVRKMISVENKGHQMMQKMGWRFGEGLGKEKSGIKEPINVMVREKNKGLGSGVLHSIGDMPDQKTVNKKWMKAKERYDSIIQDEKDLNYEAHNRLDS